MSMDRLGVAVTLPNDTTAPDLCFRWDVAVVFCEYETIFSMSQPLLNRFANHIIEFHGILDRIFEKNSFFHISPIFEQGFLITSLNRAYSPNNIKKASHD